uniref:Uncharacterized protein n=1 Tax=Ananas comosus var. bracteatus TaxID=296719 RepID=A0A6V7PVH3_ANACO|nr:unnamed protein product [Ananas comosus var. bracteatus]
MLPERSNVSLLSSKPGTISKKKKSSKHTKKNTKKEEEHQPNPPQGDGHGDAVAQEDDDGVSKASDVSSEHGNGDGEAEQTLNPEAAVAEEAPEPTNSDAEAGKLEHEEEEKVVAEQGDSPVEKTVTVIEESRVRVSEEEDSSSSSAAAASREPEARVSPISEADKTVVFAKTEVAPHATSAAHRATWWSCCGILDVFVGSK